MKNRNHVLTGLFVLMFTLFSFGQDRFATPITNDNFKTENATGIYKFVLPSSITSKEVALSAEYYTVYFKIDFNESTNIVKATMLDDSDKSRLILVRFFVSLGLKHIQHEGITMPVMEFHDKFIKSTDK